MTIKFRWLEPFRLVDGSAQRHTYVVTEADEERLPNSPGIYVFGRRHGAAFTPVYIGQAANLKTRIWSQFNNNRLMNSLEETPNGARELLVAQFISNRGQRVKKVLHLVERGLIKLALAEGFELVNKHGTHISSHAVEMSGSREARAWLPERHMKFE